jgi:hypothetical protein
MPKSQILATWFARFAVGLVFMVNVDCALVFLLQPEKYAAGFEVGGVPGENIVQGFGLLFLMWNATYPPVIFRPNAQKTLFWVILSQQAIGVIGESWLWLALPAGHTTLASTGLRFILFDGLGLVLMGIAFGLIGLVSKPKTEPETGLPR